MKTKVLKLIVATVLLCIAVTVFVGCTETPDDTSSNPYGSFTPTGSGDVSETSNAASDFQDVEKYPPGYVC